MLDNRLVQPRFGWISGRRAVGQKILLLTMKVKRGRDGLYFAECKEYHNIYAQGRTLAEVQRDSYEVANTVLRRYMGRHERFVLSFIGKAS